MAIENTSKTDPTVLLARAMFAKRLGQDIEQMEKEGQQQLCNQRSQLPTEGLEAAAGALGITVLGVTEGDELFSNVELPEGWKIVPTEHDMWTELVDVRGKVRAEIFYKAAHYDRRADIRLLENEK